MTSASLPEWVKPGSLTAVLVSTGSAGEVLRALLSPGASDPEWSLSARFGVCFISVGVPVLNHRSASENVRILSVLGGVRPPGDSAITHALRLAELPDRRLNARGSSLDRLERLAIWLAVHRLRAGPTLVVEDPARGLSQHDVNAVVRLLREATQIPSAVVVATGDASFAASLTDNIVVADET